MDSKQPNFNEFLKDLEIHRKKRLAANKIKNRDLYECLPKDLRHRVSKCIRLADLEPSADDGRTIADNEDDPNAAEPAASPRSAASAASFNPSTCTAVLDKDLQFVHLNLRLDPPPEPRRPPARKMHWLPGMLNQRRCDRIHWPSKIYNFDRMFSRLTLFEQAEQMMDWAADDFSAWLRNIGDPEEASLSAAVIKQLFSVSAEGEASKALYVEPSVKKAIPDAVAKSIGMPTLSLDYNVERLLRLDEENKKLPARKLAFDRSLPARDTFEGCADGIRPVQPAFPEEMRQKRTIFEGITHLRATKTLVDYLAETKELERPEYLVAKGMFEPEEAVAGAESGYVPLYKDFVKGE